MKLSTTWQCVWSLVGHKQTVINVVISANGNVLPSLQQRKVIDSDNGECDVWGRYNRGLWLIITVNVIRRYRPNRSLWWITSSMWLIINCKAYRWWSARHYGIESNCDEVCIIESAYSIQYTVGLSAASQDGTQHNTMASTRQLASNLTKWKRIPPLLFVD